ncbi:hypothetical protein IM792_11345 [Mucilaginibacter sp. JRF]|uniref:hypothetical protein n=1 Tax=Mucilaginibacter sp. JRF TaxID=2780088 RepID=UPI00187E0B69|nr:hypothetical protein [Mucilaginibacter sp. JRF]MBE9585045.1 hypothetical protein [Mucilaginibacter sp. JRF]
MIELNNPLWQTLEGGYKGIKYDASVALKQLEQATTLNEADAIYLELWDELHHQGDVGLASYYAVPHLVKIARDKQLVDYNVLGLITVIEVQRHKNNPPLPTQLIDGYNEAIAGLKELAFSVVDKQMDVSSTSAMLAAIAVSKGEIKLANAILNLDSEDVIDEFLENY